MSGGLEEPDASCRRDNCPSFRILLRRQLWFGSARVATSLRKLFRSRKSKSKSRRRKAEEEEARINNDEDIIWEEPESSKGRKKKERAFPSPALRKTHPESPPSLKGFLKKAPQAQAPLEPNPKHMKLVRSKRLMKEFQDLQKSQNSTKNPIFTVELVDDCLFEWKVRLLKIDSDSELARDMIEFSIPYILLNITFPDGFPFQPPFLRVLAPRLEKGFVMEGGAICMELLTPRGWASAYTIEAILMQFASSLVKGQGRVARKYKPSKEFNKRSAEQSFKFLVRTHEKYGWVTPPLAEG